MGKRIIVPTSGVRDTYEGWLDRDQFTVRRKVLLSKGTRKATPKNYKLWAILKKLDFEGAHIWPLNWGGREVDQMFWALPAVNNSIQKRAENATKRFAERLKGTGIDLYVTATAKKYGQLQLFERITYKYELVAADGRILDLGKVEIRQELSVQQRLALVDGKPVVIDPDSAVEFDVALRLDQEEAVERAFQRHSEDPPASESDARLDRERSRATRERGLDEAPKAQPSPITSRSGDVDQRLRGLDLDAPTTTLETPTVKRTLAKSILKFGRGFLIDQLIDLAIALFVGYFQRQVTEDIIRLTRDAWRRKVAPKVEPRVHHWIQKSAAGHTFNLAADQKYVYVEVEWTLMLEELRKDASDVVVWLGKFVAQDPGFGERFYDLELTRKPDIYKPRDGELARDRMEDREPNRTEIGINDYVFTQYFLVHDPDVLAIAKEMFSHGQKVHARFDEVLQEWRSALIRFEPPADLVAEVRAALDKYQFRKAAAAMARLAVAMDETSMSTRRLQKLSTVATKAMFVDPMFLMPKQRDLLDAYLGVRLESDRPVERLRAKASHSGRSSTHHTIDNPGQKFQ